MISEIAIRGDGIAATCCAKLLQERNMKAAFQADPQRAALRPTLLINSQTRKLIGDVFGADAIASSNGQLIRKRVVLWGAEAHEPQAFPHSGLAIRESYLLQSLWASVRGEAGSSAEWYIESARPALNTKRQEFGTRVAASVNVSLAHATNDACWIESLRDGWLFLLPTGNGQGSLIAVGREPAALLAESSLVGSEVAEVLEEANQFPAYPRIFVPLAAPGWLACGSAAMGFDPICGEGAGNAVREAILASAVLAQIHRGGDSAAALGQYQVRLLAGFARHLELCKQFYVSGRQSEWWDGEIEHLNRGLEWTRAQLATAPSPSGRLVGFDLVAD